MINDDKERRRGVKEQSEEVVGDSGMGLERKTHPWWFESSRLLVMSEEARLQGTGC